MAATLIGTLENPKIKADIEVGEITKSVVTTNTKP
jgi:hypothetical protein